MKQIFKKIYTYIVKNNNTLLKSFGPTMPVVCILNVAMSNLINGVTCMPHDTKIKINSKFYLQNNIYFLLFYELLSIEFEQILYHNCTSQTININNDLIFLFKKLKIQKSNFLRRCFWCFQIIWSKTVSCCQTKSININMIANGCCHLHKYFLGF